MKMWTSLPCIVLYLLGQHGAEAATGALNLLVWNPHWQCFIWNQHNCATQVMTLANAWLTEHDIDFAAFIEFESKDFRVKDGWSGLKSNEKACPKDATMLVYNTQRWQPTGDPDHSATGCLSNQDRPFVLQAFRPIDRTSNLDGVIVIGSHFPHPNKAGDGRLPFLQNLAPKLSSVMRSTGIEKVVVLADTNLHDIFPSQRVVDELGLVGKAVSTQLHHTCCANGRFATYLPFDRIIANFGAVENELMETKLLIDDPLPPWIFQEKGGKKGAFHKPVFGRLLVEPTSGATVPQAGGGQQPGNFEIFDEERTKNQGQGQGQAQQAQQAQQATQTSHPGAPGWPQPGAREGERDRPSLVYLSRFNVASNILVALVAVGGLIAFVRRSHR